MTFQAETILEAEAEDLPTLLSDVDLREWLHEVLGHQLDYQAQLSSPGTFDPAHPALDIDQFARLRALGFLGPNAMPEILGVLVHPETGGSNPVVWSLCDALMRMGTNGSEAGAPLLQRLLRDGITEYPSRIVGALVAVTNDRDAVCRSLEMALDSWNERQIQAALYALPAFEAIESLPKILELSRSASAEIRSQAALALGALGAGNEECEKRLLELTEDSEWFVRGNAIDSLGEMKATVPGVRDAALRILQESDDTPDWSAPQCAARTLIALGESGEALEKRLQQPNLSPGLAEELIPALLAAGYTGWPEQVRREYGYAIDGTPDDDFDLDLED